MHFKKHLEFPSPRISKENHYIAKRGLPMQRHLSEPSSINFYAKTLPFIESLRKRQQGKAGINMLGHVSRL